MKGTLRSETVASERTRIGLAPDDVTLAASEPYFGGPPGENVVRLFDIAKCEAVMNLPLENERAAALAFSSDSKSLFTGLTRGTAQIWNVARPEGR
jgi:hypothetical protein